MSDVERCAKRLDRAIDRYKDDIGFAALEILLQKRAQDCRELSYENEEMDTISFDEIEGYK